MSYSEVARCDEKGQKKSIGRQRLWVTAPFFFLFHGVVFVSEQQQKRTLDLGLARVLDNEMHPLAVHTLSKISKLATPSTLTLTLPPWLMFSL